MFLYRAMSPAEWADVRATGVLRPLPSSVQGKWFAETPEHAAAWGRSLSQLVGGSFLVVCIEMPTVVADQLLRLPKLDGIGPARYADDVLVALVNQNHGSISLVAVSP